MRYRIVVVGALVFVGVLTSSVPAWGATPTAAQVQSIMAKPHDQLTNADRAVLIQAVQDGSSGTAPSPGTARSSAPNPNAVASTARARVRAHTAACYGEAGTRHWQSITGGAIVAWIEADVHGWCGSGGWIYSVAGWFFPNWVNWPYCWASVQTYHAGEGGSDGAGHTSWAHGIQHDQLGVSYPWGCGGFKTSDVATRIAWNGYNDGYNDWGF